MVQFTMLGIAFDLLVPLFGVEVLKPCPKDSQLALWQMRHDVFQLFNTRYHGQNLTVNGGYEQGKTCLCIRPWTLWGYGPRQDSHPAKGLHGPHD